MNGSEEQIPPGATPRQVAELPFTYETRLWGLIHICGATQRQLVRFACDCARRQSQELMGLLAIDVAERWLRGEATAEECEEAANRAYLVARTYASDYKYNIRASASASASGHAAMAVKSKYASSKVYSGALAAALSQEGALDRAELQWQVGRMLEIIETFE